MKATYKFMLRLWWRYRYLPKQRPFFNLNPWRHLQVYEPGVLWHFESAGQISLFWEHSFISEILKWRKCGIGVGLRKGVTETFTFADFPISVITFFTNALESPANFVLAYCVSRTLLVTFAFVFVWEMGVDTWWKLN